MGSAYCGVSYAHARYAKLRSKALAVLAAGLDARAAAIVMRSVRNIVSTGRTIVCELPLLFCGILAQDSKKVPKRASDVYVSAMMQLCGVPP